MRLEAVMMRDVWLAVVLSSREARIDSLMGLWRLNA